MSEVSIAAAAQPPQDLREQQVLSEQVRLLFDNSNVSAGVTLLASTILAVLQWGTIPTERLFGWWLFMTLLTGARAVVAHRYWRAQPQREERRWLNVFVVGASAFAHNAGMNPTGTVGALAYWAAEAITSKYIKSPGALVPA